VNTLARATLVMTLQSFTWRWLCAPPVFLLAGWLRVSDIDFDLVSQLPRTINIWDIPPSMLVTRIYLSWLVVLGFIILVGDIYLQERELNIVPLMLSRLHSRTQWWLARIATLGVLAFCFVILAFVCSLLGSALRAPVSLQDSPASLIPPGSATPNPAFQRWYTIPMPIFVIIVGLYTAFGLWIIAAFIMTLSLIWSQVYVPVGFALSWIILSSYIANTPILEQFDIAYIVSYEKFFSPRLPLSSLTFTILSIVFFVGFIYFGAWRAQRIDM
jgi:hypothetical protein